MSISNFKNIVTETEHLKLVSDNIISVKAKRKTFYPENHFLGRNYYLSSGFKHYVLYPTKPFNKKALAKGGMSFIKYRLKKMTSSSRVIMSELDIPKDGNMNREEILWTIFSLTSKQQNGESGILPTDRNSITIGFLNCDDDVTREVSVSWADKSIYGHLDCRQWICYCGHTEFKSFPDHEVLYRYMRIST